MKPQLLIENYHPGPTLAVVLSQIDLSRSRSQSKALLTPLTNSVRKPPSGGFLTCEQCSECFALLALRGIRESPTFAKPIRLCSLTAPRAPTWFAIAKQLLTFLHCSQSRRLCSRSGTLVGIASQFLLNCSQSRRLCSRSLEVRKGFSLCSRS